MSKFKAGDFAITLKALSGLEAYSVVVLEEPIEPGDIVTRTPDRRQFKASARGWIVSTDTTTAAIGEKSLMPLRGDFQPENQKGREVVA
ncbi:TPA: hypothetical protein ACXJUT_001956 [Pseudomonas aeruginosa]